MQANDVDPDALRRLAELRADDRRVLTLYLNFDPQELGTREARSSVVTSVLDEAERAAEQVDLEHEARMGLREDLDRARRFLKSEFNADGAHGVALFASKPLDLFEVLRLPRPVDAGAVVDAAPHIAPIVELARKERVAVALVSRREGRLLAGTRHALEQVADLWEETHGQHTQGGWSQPRYENSVEEEARAHLRAVVARLLERHRRRPFDRLLVAAPDEVIGFIEGELHPYLRERYCGRIFVDQSAAGLDDVQRAVAAKLDELDEQREREALERVTANLDSPNGLAAAGLDDVLAALNERRVQTLLYSDGFAAPGVVDPRSGWLGVDAAMSPTGNPTEQRVNVLEPAVQAAILQAADVIRVRDDGLGPRGGIAAVLRF